MDSPVPRSREIDTDSDLVGRIRGRDDTAMTALFARHSRLVYSVAFRVLRHPDLAEDVLQEVFMQLWNNPLEAVKADRSLSAFLAVMTRNKCIDHLRRQKVTVNTDDVQLASTFNLVESSEQRVLLERVRRETLEMPIEQRSCLEMAFFEGLTHTEIAERTGEPLGTIKTRIRAALQRLERSFNT